MAKIQYKVYQSPRSLGDNPVYYGLVLNQSLSPEESLRQIMAEKQITAFQPSQLVTLIDSVLQGAIELTARDGIPRSISSLLRTHLAWDKGFASIDASPKSVPMSVRVRLLKDMRLPVDMSAFEFVPTGAVQVPKVERIFSLGTETGDAGTLSMSKRVVVTGERLNTSAETGITLEAATIIAEDAEVIEHEIALTTSAQGFYRCEFAWPESVPSIPSGTKGTLTLSYYVRNESGTDSDLIITKPVTLVS